MFFDWNVTGSSVLRSLPKAERGGASRLIGPEGTLPTKIRKNHLQAKIRLP